MIERIFSYLCGADIQNDLSTTKTLIQSSKLYLNIPQERLSRIFRENFMHDHLYRVFQLGYSSLALYYLLDKDYTPATISACALSLALIFGKRATKARKNLLDYIDTRALRKSLEERDF